MIAFSNKLGDWMMKVEVPVLFWQRGETHVAVA